MKLASLNPIFFDFRMDLDGLMIQPEVKNKTHKMEFEKASIFVDFVWCNLVLNRRRRWVV